MQKNNYKILFLTDIHQNLEGIKKIPFHDFDLTLCGGDILNPSQPDIQLAKSIIDFLPETTIIVPGNCEKNNEITDYMKSKLNFIHKKQFLFHELPITGVGFCRHLKIDLMEYRKFFLEDQSRILNFKNNKLSFLLKHCGIQIDENNNIKTVPMEEALEMAKDFIAKFQYFADDEINNFFQNEALNKGGIVLSHSPPFGILDQLEGLPHIGSRALQEGIKTIQPRLVLCGHFHELANNVKINDILYFNPGAVANNKYGIIYYSHEKIEIEFKSI